MDKTSNLLSQISMVTANYNESAALTDVLQDWFDFLGGKPGEVVVIDCGSNSETQAVYWKMFQEGMIDKLQLIHPDNDDFGKEQGYIKEYTAGAISNKPYVLTFKTDTLPYRKGNDGWLEEAIGYLDREEVFAISGSWNLPSMHSDAWPGWYYSKKCSYNFALMKRSTFMAAAHEYANDYILSGFKGENPAVRTGQGRYFIEVAFEKYIERHNLLSLCKIEDPNWSVFHTNTHEELLKETREKYIARQDIEKFLNIGYSDKEPDYSKAIHYGLPAEKIHPVKRVMILFGKSPLGPYWRNFKAIAASLLQRSEAKKEQVPCQ
jgi:glycosyltransferase involved in cell wall biosynthesis